MTTRMTSKTLTDGECYGLPWRAGRSVGRTLYVVVNDEASKSDVLIGLVDTVEIAAHIVRVHNAWLQRQSDGSECGDPLTGASD